MSLDRDGVFMNANKLLLVHLIVFTLLGISCGSEKKRIGQRSEQENSRQEYNLSNIKESDSEEWSSMISDLGSNKMVRFEREYSTFTDARDGKIYKTVKINDQIWMAENLNYVVDDSWCYNNIDSNCVIYGRLYKWDAAMMTCPTGWRLPNTEDWNNLVLIAGGKRQYIEDELYYYWSEAGEKLKSNTNWNICHDYDEDNFVDCDGGGTDNLGFSALPGGFRGVGGNFYEVGAYGYWWGATEYGNERAWYWCIRSGIDAVYEKYGNTVGGCSFSVRCIQE